MSNEILDRSQRLSVVVRRRLSTAVLASAAAICVCALGACSPYMLSGRVIEGEASYATLVAPDDPRLQSPGITGASLRLTRDPGRLKRDVVTERVSGAQGEFELPVDRVGAGLLEMDMGVLARMTGYSSAEGFFGLPGAGKSRLLIVLAPGDDPVGVRDDQWSADDDLRRFGNP